MILNSLEKSIYFGKNRRVVVRTYESKRCLFDFWRVQRWSNLKKTLCFGGVGYNLLVFCFYFPY